VEEDEQVAGPLVQDPVQVPPVVASQLRSCPSTCELCGNGSGGSL
jgi:hypothetical protein